MIPEVRVIEAKQVGKPRASGDDPTFEHETTYDRM